MNKKKLFSIVLFLLLCLKGFTQNQADSLHLNFNIEFNHQILELNKQYITSKNDTIALKTFKCYISSVQIHYSDNSLFTEKDSYHLLDLENPNTLHFPITKSNDKIISKVTFNIGIDSLTNTSGAMSGDLDPTKGMYWAWQSGYVNMKIEGKSSSCNPEGSGRKNEFQFHIGGYMQPNYAMRSVEILTKNEKLNITIDVAEFFSKVKLSETNSIMIPGKKAMQLADYSVKMFKTE